MQDRFKFRAKRIDNNSFVTGYLCFIYVDNSNIAKIYCLDDCYNYDVYTETLGQCTGFKDKNKNLIYENDIVEILRNPLIYDDIKENELCKVVFKNYAWFMQNTKTDLLTPLINYEKNGLIKDFELKVIGYNQESEAE